MNIIDKIKNRFNRTELLPSLRWVGFTAVTITHIIIIAVVLSLVPMSLAWWMVPLAIVLPGIITMTLMPSGWRRWYRWVALLGLVLMVSESSSNPFVVILFGETWMLHRAWVTERTIPVNDLFRRGKAKEPSTASARKPKGSSRTKTA
ncbi:hypothetical protein IV500_04580 [Paeniglutamicibacter antarcticus]|uniref:Uncharacterized protein n=1 Tax=Arthrobacter terrae TaxID=2935737 RepID=A0A931CHJ0_9MICC|nr:hypothetical protein [Arthrobacter terrae]MBG0738697.1 hypothetical protein [Arthrobacter terrae]